MIPEPLYQLLDFNIDRYLNPFIPRNHLYLLPRPISHFLGWRDTPHKEPLATVQWVLTVLSTIAGLVTVGAVYNYAPGLQSWNPPPMIASLGAAAILEYNAVRSPFAQPRNCIVGHTLAAVVAVGVAKAFMLAPGFYDDYMWIAGVVSCAAASLAMSMTNTVHPPGGAAAILACTEKQIIELGWMFPVLILLATAIMTPIAQLFNNTLRQYPVYWWTPDETGSMIYPRSKKAGETASDVESGDRDNEKVLSSSDVSPGRDRRRSQSEETLHMHTVQSSKPSEIEAAPGLEAVHIAPYMIRAPPNLYLSEEESEVLSRVMRRLRVQLEDS